MSESFNPSKYSDTESYDNSSSIYSTDNISEDDTYSIISVD